MEKVKRILRLVKYFLLCFVALYVFRFIYGYTDPNMKGYEENEYISDYLNNIEAKKNYASSQWSRKMDIGTKDKVESVKENTNDDGGKTDVQTGEQKFEKIASLKAKSDKFEPDDKAIREKVKKYNALIQYEHTEGNPGNRELHLSIGVPPESFDSFLAEMKQVGKLKSIQVTKTDKTNEYRNLNAQKASLEKTRNTLIELKNKEGKIDEFIALSNRILEIEEQLQGLGVSLGDFDAENEFCTVQFTLAEGRFIPISFMHRAKVALEWTINYFCIFMLIVFFASGASFCIVWIYDKLKGQK
ncbi:MAG: DUF4349 domain-containing protein [Bacteroidota bacterium]|nr:DUF4349 domain-containing protein [Bacteroidota bacterium]